MSEDARTAQNTWLAGEDLHLALCQPDKFRESFQIKERA